MNRLVLIGNGFDLAHGLKTRYEDFINWYNTNVSLGIRLNSGQQKNGGANIAVGSPQNHYFQ